MVRAELLLDGLIACCAVTCAKCSRARVFCKVFLVSCAVFELHSSHNIQLKSTIKCKNACFFHELLFLVLYNTLKTMVFVAQNVFLPGCDLTKWFWPGSNNGVCFDHVFFTRMFFDKGVFWPGFFWPGGALTRMCLNQDVFYQGVFTKCFWPRCVLNRMCFDQGVFFLLLLQKSHWHQNWMYW